MVLPALLAGRREIEIESRAKDLLSWLHLEDRLDHLPSQLSGGEQQRTAIARVLINDPPVILADEPTGNPDSRNGEVVIELLVELKAPRRNEWNSLIYVQLCYHYHNKGVRSYDQTKFLLIRAGTALQSLTRKWCWNEYSGSLNQVSVVEECGKKLQFSGCGRVILHC